MIQFHCNIQLATTSRILLLCQPVQLHGPSAGGVRVFWKELKMETNGMKVS